MKSVRVIFCLVPLLVAAACSPAPAPPPTHDTKADEATVRGVTEAFLKAYNAGDLTGMGADCADDAVEMREGGPELVGKSAIMAEAAKEFADNSLAQTATVDEVVVWGDLAMSRGTWQVTTTPKKAGGKPVVNQGKWLVIHKRATDGSWDTWRHIWNMDAAAPPPSK